MMRRLLSAAALLTLAACTPAPIETQGGVGFESYSLYQQQQAAIRRSQLIPRNAPVTSTPVTSTPVTATSTIAAPATASQAIAADTLAALGAGRPAATAPLSATAPVTVQPVAPVVAPQPVAPAPATLAPAPVPGQVDTSNIAAYALTTSHPVGQQVYRRSNPFRQGAGDKACARYASPALAQEAFLQAGGPVRDRLNLDPDGDGYACGWNPAPFRLARPGG